MKFIQKGREPAELRTWRLENKTAPQNLLYTNIPKDALQQTRLALLTEQGYLCAYTMLRIADARKGHVEHIVAQSRDDVLQVRFSNMVYCYPGESEPHCAFGAHAKDGQPVGPNRFISPLEENCECRFGYSKNGSVSPVDGDDMAARGTLEILKLNSPDLQKARQAAIQSLPIFLRNRPPISSSQAQREAEKLLIRDRQGRFREFAVALAQVMTKYARQKAARQAALGAR